MKKFWERSVPVTVGLCFSLTLICVVLLIFNDDRSWSKFRDGHACVVKEDFMGVAERWECDVEGHRDYTVWRVHQ